MHELHQACANLIQGGKDDWRLPTKGEMEGVASVEVAGRYFKFSIGALERASTAPIFLTQSYKRFIKGAVKYYWLQSLLDWRLGNFDNYENQENISVICVRP